MLFQSTAPVWGPTVFVLADLPDDCISIHGPRVGADGNARLVQPPHQDFNPRPPCGGRLAQSLGVTVVALFQSTAPVWGPTWMPCCFWSLR